MLFCTHLTFDLILSPRDISRIGIHPYRVYYGNISIIGMDAGFYSILPSKVKISQFCLNGQSTNMTTGKTFTLPPRRVILDKRANHKKSIPFLLESYSTVLALLTFCLPIYKVIFTLILFRKIHVCYYN